MKKQIIMSAMLAALMMLSTCKRAEQGLVVTVQFSVGNARIVSAKGEKAASTGDIVSYDDSIVTGPASVIDLNFGAKGVIRITENSDVKMASLKIKTGNDQVQFDMKNGKMYVVMSKLSKEAGFSVKTRTTIAAIRGTSFMVVSDPKDSRVYVLKGRILVQLAREGKLAEKIETMLEANKKVIVSEDLANEIIAGKKKLEVAALNPKEISEIKEEIKKIKVSEKLDQETQKELTEITRDSEIKRDTTIQKKQETPNKDIQNIPSI